MAPEQITKIHKRHILLMSKTIDILGHVLKHIPQEKAQTLRDGLDGWTILEIICHLRDFNGFFHARAQMMLAEDHPALPAYDHETLVIERDYNHQDIAYVYEELVQSRRAIIAFFETLTPDQWQRTGIHPERGYFTMTDAVMQVGLHDIDHLEQLTRVLEQDLPDSGGLPTEAHISTPGDGETGNS